MFTEVKVIVRFRCSIAKKKYSCITVSLEGPYKNTKTNVCVVHLEVVIFSLIKSEGDDSLVL